MKVTAYHIDNYETIGHPYEKHYLHKNVQVTPGTINMKFTEGDYFINTNQGTRRYLVETLEPTAPDGFFAWNFFDGILQQKEGFSDYVFEDIAAEIVDNNTDLRKKLAEKRKQDPEFAKNGAVQLEFVYRNSEYFEPSVNRYPVYRID